MKITSPNYTQVPTHIVDEWLPHLNEYELKILLKIVQKSNHSNKNPTELDLDELIKFTKITRENLINAIESLSIKGIIKIEYDEEVK